MLRFGAILALFLSAAVLGAQQDIDIQRPVGISIPNGGAHDLGTVSTFGSFFNFRCANTGNANLSLVPASTPVAVGTFSNCSGSVSLQPSPSLINGGGYTSFQIQVTPASTASFSLLMTVGSDDPDENPYDIFITGNNGSIALELQRPAGTALNPWATDNVGTISVAPNSFTYRAYNTGTGNLVFLAPVVTSEAANVAATVTSQPTGPVTGGNYASFTVQITPQASGGFAFRMDVFTNDPYSPQYAIYVAGNLSGGTRDIDLQQPAASSIADGSYHQVGTISPAAPSSMTFTIANVGGGAVKLLGMPVTVSVPHNCAASLQTGPGMALIPGPSQSTTFTISFQPNNTSAFSYRLVVQSDDPDEAYYTIYVVGNNGGSGGTQEIDIQRPWGTSVTHQGSDDLGSAFTAFQTTPMEWDIFNLGGTPLAIPASAASFNTTVNCIVSFVAQPISGPLDPYGVAGVYTYAFLHITPQGSGTFSFTLLVDSDDADEDPYEINVTGTAGAGAAVPEIDLRRFSGTSVPSGSSDMLGTQPLTPTNFTWQIHNVGGANLNLTGGSPVSVSASNNCNVSVYAQPSVSSVAPGAYTTTVIEVQPLSAAAFSFTLNVASNDSDENPYALYPNGMGTGTATPDIDLQRPNGTTRPNNSTDNIGSVSLTPTNFSWEIHNVGTGILTLTGASPVAVMATGNCNVSVAAQPPVTSISGGTSTTVVIQVEPLAAASFTFTMTVASDDANENPYTLYVTGTGTGGAQPDIDLQRPNGTSRPHNGTDDAGTVAAMSPTNVVWEIHNTGSATLNLTGATPVFVSNATGCSVSVAAQPALLAIPGLGSYTTFVIQVQPLTSGPFSFQLSVASDDPNENPYILNVVGNQGGGGGGGGDGGGGGCSTDGSGTLYMLALLGLLCTLAVRPRKG
jgi:hypothetical protein